jgi:hypothetical protein
MSTLGGFLLLSGEGGGAGSPVPGGQNFYYNQEVIIENVVPRASVEESLIVTTVEDVSVTGVHIEESV